MNKQERTVFAHKCLFDFIAAVHNYRLYNLTKLIKYGTRVCLAYESYDFDSIIKNYPKFSQLIQDGDLYGTADLYSPILDIANRAEKEYILLYPD